MYMYLDPSNGIDDCYIVFTVFLLTGVLHVNSPHMQNDTIALPTAESLYESNILLLFET